MPKETRNSILQAAADSAQDHYLNDKQLTDFEAFDEDCDDE